MHAHLKVQLARRVRIGSAAVASMKLGLKRTSPLR
jgi:hypothetical protein